MAQGQAAAHASHYYVSGFGSLADFVSSEADRSAAVYRRFDRLAARDLLYYQSELARLEALQDQYDIEDARDLEKPDLWGPIRSHAQEWEVFSPLKAVRTDGQQPDGDRDQSGAQAGAQAGVQSVPDQGDGRWRRRWDLAMEIRKTVREYRELLVQESTLLALKRPSGQTMTALSNYFHSRSSSGEGTYPTLTGASSNLYPRDMTSAQIQASDYVSLSQQPAPDPLTSFLTTYCSRLFRTAAPPLLPQYHEHDTISHLPRRQITHYSLHLVAATTTFITTLAAAILLFLPIFVLYNVSRSRPALTLGLTALFTVIFAGAIAVLTSARRAEIFGACAAYAAVLVVFVSGDFAAGNAGQG